MSRPATRTVVRGVVAPFVAISMVFLLTFVALAIDIGFIYDRHAEMQRSVDAAALAGAAALPKGDDQPHIVAREYAASNEVLHEGLRTSELTITRGNWDGLTRTFIASPGGAVSPSALRVEAERTGIPLYFGFIAGTNSTEVAKEAIAVAGAGKCLGLWALETITGRGDIYTDSYDSTAGVYGGGNMNPNGDLCANQGIDLDGSVTINGDVMYGDGYTLTLNGSANEINGTVGSHCCAVTAPPFDMAAAALANDNATIPPCSKPGNPPPTYTPGPLDLVVDGGCRTLTLGDAAGAPRTYYFTSISVSGQGLINIVGPTSIYIDGGIADFAGNSIINVSQNPNDLKIYSTGTNVTFRGGSDFYGGVVAPNAAVSLQGTTAYYGVLIGRTVEVAGNSEIHVDESLVEDLFGLDPVSPILVR